jgi:hypothetical protein
MITCLGIPASETVIINNSAAKRRWAVRDTDHGGRPCEMRMVFFLVEGDFGSILRSRLLGVGAPPPSAGVAGASMNE